MDTEKSRSIRKAQLDSLNALGGYVSRLRLITSDVTKIAVYPTVFFLIWVGTVWPAAPPELLPDGSLKPGMRITILAGKEREFLFRPEGVRFLSGRARIISVGGLLTDPQGREMKEFVIDVDRSPSIPWMHNEKPFRLRIRAETDFTLEARQSWEGNPEKDSPKPYSL